MYVCVYVCMSYVYIYMLAFPMFLCCMCVVYYTYFIHCIPSINMKAFKSIKIKNRSTLNRDTDPSYLPFNMFTIHPSVQVLKCLHAVCTLHPYVETRAVDGVGVGVRVRCTGND